MKTECELLFVSRTSAFLTLLAAVGTLGVVQPSPVYAGSSPDVSFRPSLGYDRGGAAYGGYGGYRGYGGGGGLGGGYHGSSRYVEEETQKDYLKDSKYYYGGQYKGGCQGDGLYYKDDTTFVICSNGYPHQQPCPPGTKTSGSPAYKPGYYYGYTDLCSVNLVDYGLSPEHYAPVGYAAPAGHDRGRQYGRDHREGGETFVKKEISSYDRHSAGGASTHLSHIHKEKSFQNDHVTGLARKDINYKDTVQPLAHGLGYNHPGGATVLTSSAAQVRKDASIYTREGASRAAPYSEATHRAGAVYSAGGPRGGHHSHLHSSSSSVHNAGRPYSGHSSFVAESSSAVIPAAPGLAYHESPAVALNAFPTKFSGTGYHAGAGVGGTGGGYGASGKPHGNYAYLQHGEAGYGTHGVRGGLLREQLKGAAYADKASFLS